MNWIQSFGFTALLSAGIVSQAIAADEAKPDAPLFPDKNLEKAVRKNVFEKRDNDKPLVESDVVNISIIQGVGMNITNLAGLEKCTSLASIDLARNSIKDLAPIKNLDRVQFLNLAKNEVEDISPLASMKALQYVELSANHVKDVKPLEGLTNMASLYLSTNQISDVSPLTKYPKISSLYLAKNQIKTIDGLGNLHSLFTLSLNDNEVSDISTLKGLTNLFYLFLENNKIENLGPLVESASNDKERRFAPFLNLFVKGNPLSDDAKNGQLKALKETGVRVKSE
jgi:Leucine-rich repeat (LRR) protein